MEQMIASRSMVMVHGLMVAGLSNSADLARSWGREMDEARQSASAPPPEQPAKKADFLALDAKAPAARFTGSSQRETGLIGEAGGDFEAKARHKPGSKHRLLSLKA